MERRIWGPTNVTGQERLRYLIIDVKNVSWTLVSFLLVVRFLPFYQPAAATKEPTATVCRTAGGLSHIAVDPKHGDWDQLQPPYAKHRWHIGSWSLTF